MKNTISIYLFALIFFALGCSTSKKSTVKKYQGSEDSIVYYHVNAKSTENGKYDALIENQFKELETLELPFVKIHFNKKEAIKYDCDIEIVFDELTITDEESFNNKHFPEVQGKNTRSDRSVTTSSTGGLRGYVYQQIKKRKLNWDIIIKINSDSNNCELANSSFTERFIAKSINNTLSGDESLIPRKYKDPLESQEPLGKPLLSKREMTEEAIKRVYTKIEKQLTKNH